MPPVRSVRLIFCQANGAGLSRWRISHWDTSRRPGLGNKICESRIVYGAGCSETIVIVQAESPVLQACEARRGRAGIGMVSVQTEQAQ